MEMEMQQEPDSQEFLKRLCGTAAGSASWMKLLGVLSIIQGVIAIATIWGILVAWLPIWLGIILFKAANDAEMAAAGLSPKLEDYLKKLNKYFLIQGILALVGIIVALIFIFFVGLAWFFGMGHLID